MIFNHEGICGNNLFGKSTHKEIFSIADPEQIDGNFPGAFFFAADQRNHHYNEKGYRADKPDDSHAGGDSGGNAYFGGNFTASCSI